MNLTFEKFNPQHFPEYRSWFEDPDLNRNLGPAVDQEWLDSVMNESDGCQYSVFDGEALIAVVGIKFPDDEHPTYGITDIAVKPRLRGRGIGSQVLGHLMALHPPKPGESWVAFVDERNPRARAFLEKQGWICDSDQPDEHGMFKLTVT